ncbi:MAG: hypothetical protein R3F60_16930 [bacterium]
MECSTPNPAGCRQTGCPVGQACEVLPDDCIASSCQCDPVNDVWGCTEDCGGGRCVPAHACEGPNPQGCFGDGSGCAPGEVCQALPDDCRPSGCGCDAETGTWICTADCGGGTCVAGPMGCEGPSPAGCRQTGCPAGQACEVLPNDCRPSSCMCTDAGQWACTRDCGGGTCVPAANTRWFLTCGDPVCRGHMPHEGVPRCADEVLGDPCAVPGGMCDPGDACNALMVCTDVDPRQGPCPISKAEFKRDIQYVQPAERERLRAAVEAVKLATWRYRSEPADARPHLGFIIDDGVPVEALRPSGDQVDLYGYTTLAVAALQAQAAELAALRAEVEALRTELRAIRAAAPPEVRAPAR